MPDGFPQYGPSAKQGNRGVMIVSRIVDGNFGWLFKRNHEEHDFGIDRQIEIVTDEGAVTGQMLACQIKCGKSFFCEKNRWGYVFRGKTKHLNYLANYPLPVIIVICDPETNEGYWVLFQTGDAEVTGSGWKLTSPFDNKLSASKAKLLAMLPGVTDHLSELTEYWHIHRMLFSFETFLFIIERDEVEAGDVSRVCEFWARLLSKRELALHCQGKVELSFSGYDDDARALFEVEEVREYMALLDRALPELFFFIRTEVPAATLKLFMFSLFWVGWEDQRSTPDKPGKVIVDFSKSGPFLTAHFASLNRVSKWVELPDSEVLRISKAVMTSFFPEIENLRL
jgi:hypothetical protein